MNYFIAAFTKYFTFSGRARRAEYWYFILFVFIISLLLTILGQMNSTFILLSNIFAIFIIIPSLSLSSRRLHDIEKSAWWILIQLIPLIGTIWFIVLMAKKGTVGQNKYGPDPKMSQ